jgi:hypothetical protein
VTYSTNRHVVRRVTRLCLDSPAPVPIRQLFAPGVIGLASLAQLVFANQLYSALNWREHPGSTACGMTGDDCTRRAPARRPKP